MNLINKYSTTIITGPVIFLIVLLLRSRYNLHNELSDLEVKGIITKIELREKKMPFLYINSSWVYFGKYSYTIDRYLDEGDSIAKENNSDRIELYKKKSESLEHIKYKKVEEILI